MTPKYSIGSGYFERGYAQRWFYHVWLDTVLKYADPKPQQILVLASGGFVCPQPHPLVLWAKLFGDMGHCSHLLDGKKLHHFCGGTSTVMALAMMAYANETDFIYYEQDGLAIGPWVERMYAEIGNRGCIFGSCRAMNCHQSLMLVKHAAIPEYVRLYLGTGRENTPDNMGESKHCRLQVERPDFFTRYSFGCDRDRPIPYADPVFWAQKLSRDEMLEMRRRKLIAFNEEVQGKFTNA